jgi:flagellar biosynthesis chaperone FliJ
MKKLLLSFLIFSATLYGLFRIYDFFAKFPENKIHTEILSIPLKLRFKKEEWKQYSNFSPVSEIRYFAGNPFFPVFDAYYRLDGNAMRAEVDRNPNATEHIFYGGCSMVFGVALNEQDTLSSVTRTKFPHINAVNFGFPGGGLQNLLRAMDFFNLHDYAKEEVGTFIYMFQPDHLERWLATPKYLHWALKDVIHYEVVDNKLRPMKLSETSVFKKYHSFKNAGLEHSYLTLNAINEFKEKDLETFVMGLKELRSRYLSLYPKGKFMVAVLPAYSKPETVAVLKAILTKENIEIHDFISEFDEHLKKNNLDISKFHVPVDGHPNRLFNEFLSERIVSRMAGQKAK